MHPLVARIHPSYRTAIVSWFFARAIAWIAHASSGVLAFPLLFSPDYGRGAPLWAGWVRLCRRLDAHAVTEVADLGTLVMVGAGELALLGGAVAVYRFARTDELPQTAERATWLWALCPAMALTVPIASWAFAACGVAAALAALESRRWLAATFALAIAIGFRAEAMLVWPGFIWTAYRAYRPKKDSGLGPWLATFGPLGAFTGVVGSAILLAGDYGVSLRGLHPGSEWRSDLVWDGLGAETPVLILAAAATVGLVLLMRATVRDTGRGLAAAGPLLVWPLLHEPSMAAAGALLFAIPAFVVLARNMDDRSFERPAMVAFTVGLFLLIV
ncbi:MAG: hypothetical protein ABEN55_23335 [Bradymonadaceae bacterium]